MCAFDNRPRLKTCSLCGTSREVAVALAMRWGLDESSVLVRADNSTSTTSAADIISSSTASEEEEEEEGGGKEKTQRSMSLNITINNDADGGGSPAATAMMEEEDDGAVIGRPSTDADNVLGGMVGLSPSARVMALGARRMNQLTLR